MVEARGIPTTVIGLVRPHMEKSAVPRGLFVPFQLGRPLGEPEDKAFQRRVLLAALELLERTDGPSIIVDFPDDAPGATDRPGWQPPFRVPITSRPAPGDVIGWQDKLRDEMLLVQPNYARGLERRGRTTVGVSGQPPKAWPDYAATFLGGALPFPPPGLPSAALALRFLADDLKAWYSEAALADGGSPSSRQLDQWFWRETIAGALLQAVRRAGMASDNNALKTMATRFLVPGPYVEA
jgi:hypothetical protein